MSDRDPRRGLPSVDLLLGQTSVRELGDRYGAQPVQEALRAVLGAARVALAEGNDVSVDPEGLAARAARWLEARHRPTLMGVINGTGVVLHTNLGRAPLAEEARDAWTRAAGYVTVEYDLDAGTRGRRSTHCARALRDLTGAEAALVVNNNAAAVSLAVNELARGRQVLVSRGELVEIGGSFRIPDVVARSGARLAEVGTTNRTRLADYERAIGPDTAAILKVHPSNYRVAGFTAEVGLAELVELAGRHDLPVVHDVGSGLLDADLLPGFPEEPAVRASIAAGADLVTFSGDKLFGGPQAGMIVGREAWVERLRANPLARAFRVDKMTLAALEATLALYRDRERSRERVPALRMLTERPESVRERAERCLAASTLAGRVEVAPMKSVVGGGSFPGLELASSGWVISSPAAEALARACRQASPPLIGTVREGAFHVDFRTITEEQHEAVAAIVAGALDPVEAA